MNTRIVVIGQYSINNNQTSPFAVLIGVTCLDTSWPSPTLTASLTTTALATAAVVTAPLVIVVVVVVEELVIGTAAAAGASF